MRTQITIAVSEKHLYDPIEKESNLMIALEPKSIRSLAFAVAVVVAYLFLFLCPAMLSARPVNVFHYPVRGPHLAIAGKQGDTLLSSDTLVAAISVSSPFSATSPGPVGPSVVIAIYEDGTIIWSDDRVRGGGGPITKSLSQRKR